FSAKDGWHESAVDIPLPKPRHDNETEASAPHFQVKGTYHRRLTELIRAAAEDSRFAERYHWIPHMYFWQPSPAPDGDKATPTPAEPLSSPSPAESPIPPSPSPPPCPSSPPPPSTSSNHPLNDHIRIFTDVYNSNAALREFESIRQRPRNPQDAPDVEYVMAPLLIWSDATHLTSFGSASLWPIYLYFGALSKYVRGMPTEFAAHHLAYIPSLPDELQDYYLHVYGTPISADVLTFCKRELMQRIWMLLLDDEFLDAYENGIVVVCGDGVTRRIFPRILTYSADYPEKILLTALKPLSRHPCPRCLVSKDELCLAGTPQDMHDRRAHKREDTPALKRRIAKARKLVFKGASLGSKRVQDLLEAEGLNPIQSAFSARLSRFGLNHYQLFVPDLMHEFEIGVWKNTFAHLLRLLAAQGLQAVHEFNRRMRLLPTFGRDTIRKFWNDVAARKQLAARDYEDFLICMMPVFEGLLPLEDDRTVTDLLFELANWHALAKLRLHTSVTLDIFRAATQHMCEAMRRFARTTCENHETCELPKEAEARIRREEKKNSSVNVNRTPKVVRFNVLNTYKYHSLPDYPDYVEEGGTTDNGNTQVCELEHRHVKRYYVRTNKIRYTLQIAKHQRRSALLRALRDQDRAYVPRRVRLRQRRSLANRPPHGDAVMRYAISQTQRAPLRLHAWLSKHREDASVKNFIPLLRAHLFGRLTNRTDYDEFTPQDLDHVHIDQERIFQHKSLQVNYTTYDMRRNQDVINPRTHADIMLLANRTAERTDHDGSSPYWYARVLNIFHAFVRYSGPDGTRASREWQQIDFLWVRWYEDDPDYVSGFQERRLPRVRFADANDPDVCPFGFVDPREVLRGAYIMPAFAHGTTLELLGPSPLARRSGNTDEDYEFYYVGIFADRDIYMRHLGGGVGHLGVGVTVAESREHALRVEREETPEVDDQLDMGTPAAVALDDGMSQASAEPTAAGDHFDEDSDPDVPVEPCGQDSDSDDEENDYDANADFADDDWHVDVGLGGLFDEELAHGLGEDVEEPGYYGYEEYDDEDADPYSVEGFAPL
ncbi:hypothetical protein FKP32DRAFT_1567909, partial [Trametes sanguinea]